MTRTFSLVLLTFLMVIFVSPFAMAQEPAKVGDTIPHDLSLKDQNGKMHNFSDLTGSKGLVLVFIRSAEWCPYCKKQLNELNDNAKKFKEAGYPVVSVSYDAVAQLSKFATEHKPSFTMLSDPASASIRAFGILNEANAKGTFSYGIPYPGVYIVSKDKKIQAKFFESDYTKRPSAKTILAKIEELNPPPMPSLDEMGEDPILPGEEVITTPEKMTEPIVLPEDTMPSEETLPETPAVVAPAPETSIEPVIAPAPIPPMESEPSEPTAEFDDFELPPMPQAAPAP